jgi:hypothetical protein
LSLGLLRASARSCRAEEAALLCGQIAGRYREMSLAEHPRSTPRGGWVSFQLATLVSFALAVAIALDFGQEV